jgi:hypothetical protein
VQEKEKKGEASMVGGRWERKKYMITGGTHYFYCYVECQLG